MPTPIRPEEVPEGQEENLEILKIHFRNVAAEIERLVPGIPPKHDPEWLKDELYRLTRKIMAAVR